MLCRKHFEKINSHSLLSLFWMVEHNLCKDAVHRVKPEITKLPITLPEDATRIQQNQLVTEFVTMQTTKLFSY